MVTNMGIFSWKTCDSERRIMVGKQKNVYLLIPKEFGGGHIVETCYDGYGRFGGKDIYELIVDWNRDYIMKQGIEVAFANEREEIISYVRNYFAGKKGYEKRVVGVYLACTDERNSKIPYPIKLSHRKTAVYEKENWSKMDPRQGCL